jgi:hypothetical protein
MDLIVLGGLVDACCDRGSEDQSIGRSTPPKVEQTFKEAKQNL